MKNQYKKQFDEALNRVLSCLDITTRIPESGDVDIVMSIKPKPVEYLKKVYSKK